MKNNLKKLQEIDNYKELICEFNNEFLDEIIISSYEYEINKFFGRIVNLRFDIHNKDDKNKAFFKRFYNNTDNKTLILFDLSCDIFEECLEFLENIFNNKEIKIENENLCILYSITYIKIYLNKLVFFICTKFKNMLDIKPIIDILCGTKSNNFRKVIKIYAYKLFFNFFNRNWNEINSFDFKKHQIDIFNDLFEDGDNYGNKQNKTFLTYCFLPLDSENDYEKYIRNKIDFENKEKNSFKFVINEFPQYIKEDEIDVFLCLLINKIFSNLDFINYLEDRNKYEIYLSKYKSLLTDNCASTNNKKQFTFNKLLLLFFNIEIYNSKIKPKIESKQNFFNPELLEIILYGFRFCAQALNYSLEAENFYSLLFKENYLLNLKKSCVPGNDYEENAKLNSLVKIEEHLMQYPDDMGCYVCSCGLYYSIDPWGFPTEGQTFKCPECQQDIGYGKRINGIGASNHGMVIRPGHYRIFRDLKHKEEQMTKYGDCDENIPNRTLDQYKKEVIEPILKNSNYGINRISKNTFLKKDKNIRNMSQITYRLLNFLLYNHLFYANCLDYISDEQLKNYLHENMSCLEIIREDWKLLEEALEVKNIASIQIFINLIFKRLSDLIKNCNLMENPIDRDQFEYKVENLVSKCIEEYPNYEKKAIKLI